MEKKKKSIRNPINKWSEDDRPREKLLHKGVSALSNAELLAILLGSGNKDESAVDLARRVLNNCQENLICISKLSINDLMAYKGIGQAKAVNIAAALELGRRRRSSEALEKNKITNSKDAFELFQGELADTKWEGFMILLLKRSNQIIDIIKISEGGLSGTIADPKKIFKSALERNTSAIILCHNHPSGNTKPSESDIALTKKLKSGGSLLDINILDHIILGDETYFSFADEGLL